MLRPVNLHVLADLDRTGRAALLDRAEADIGPFLERVRPILAAVRDEGDAALSRFALEFDQATVAPDAIAATSADFDRALAGLAPEVVAAIEFAAGSIRKFHADQMPEEMWLHEIRPGAFAGDRFRPIPSVACYVPREKTPARFSMVS